MNFTNWILVSVLLLYFMDSSVLGVSLRKLRSSEKPISVKALPDISDLTFNDDSQYIPIKILSKKELPGNSKSDFESIPDAYLFLSEPVKVTASKKSYPVLEGRLIMASNIKKKNLNNYAITGYPHTFTGDLLPPSTTDNYDKVITSEMVDEDNQESGSVDEPIIVDISEEIGDVETNVETDVFDVDEEISDQIVSELAEEILKELEESDKIESETFLTEDGQTLITLPDMVTGNFEDDTENVLVTSTFETINVDEFGKEITSTTPMSSGEEIEPTIRSRVNRYIESPRKTNSINSIVDGKPSVLSSNINVEKFFRDLRVKWEAGIPPLQIMTGLEDTEITTNQPSYETNDIDSGTDESINVYELLTTTGSNLYDTTTSSTEKNEDETISTTECPSDSSEVTTFDPRFDEKEEQETTTETTESTTSTTQGSTTILSTLTPVVTEAETTTTPIPLKKSKSPKKKKTSSDPLSFFQEFTQDDIEVLKSLFRSAKYKKSPRNRRTKEKRSHPDEFWSELLKKASPRLKALAKIVKTEIDIVETTTIPETTTTILPTTTTDASVKTTLRTTPIETTTVPTETLSDYLDQNTQEMSSNRIDDTLHSKRAAQHLFSSDTVSPFASLKERFQGQEPSQSLIQPLPPLREGNLKKPAWIEKLEKETSEEREHRLEHDLQKMIKFVGVLSKIDGFFMDRTKSAVRKLGTLLDDDDGVHHDRRRKRRNQLYY